MKKKLDEVNQDIDQIITCCENEIKCEELKDNHISDVNKMVFKLMSFFPESFINRRNELILNLRYNVYFRLADVKTELELKCKVIEWISRPAHKEEQTNKRVCKIIRESMNKYLKTSFTVKDLSIIYTYLGNNIRRNDTISFIMSGYDINYFKKFKGYYDLLENLKGV